jgi:hypothetical protein
MLDIPKIGVPLINGIISRVAEYNEDPAEMEQTIAVLETCKALTADTELKRGIKALSKSSKEYVQREKDVQKSLMETLFVRRMM